LNSSTKKIGNLYQYLIVGVFFTISLQPLGAFANGDQDIRVTLAALIKGDPIEQILENSSQLTLKHNNFRLAHLLYADLLSLLSGDDMKSVGGDPSKCKACAPLYAQAKLRLSTPTGLEKLVPMQILRISNSIQFVFLVDLEASRAYLLKNQGGVPTWVADYYVSIGKSGFGKSAEGDQRTPVGLYQITGTLSGNALGDFYGPRAWFLNYPNHFDRSLNRSGGGIWFHGTPKLIYDLDPLTSNGCIVFANEDIEEINKRLRGRSAQVFLTPNVKWIETDHWMAEINRINNDMGLAHPSTIKPSNEQIRSHYYSGDQSYLTLGSAASTPKEGKLKHQYWTISNGVWAKRLEYE
jgi:hypothetical protein